MAGSAIWREVRNGGKGGGAKWREERYGGKPYAIAPAILFFFPPNINAHYVLGVLPLLLSVSSRRTDGRTASCIDWNTIGFWFLAPSSKKNERSGSVVASIVRPSASAEFKKYPIMSLPLLFHLGNSYNPVGRPRGSYQNSNSFPCWLFHFSFLLFVSLFQYIEFPHLNTDTYVGLSSPCFLLRRLESICFLVFHPPFLVAPSRLIPPAARASFFPSRYHGWTDDTTPL